MTCHHVSELLLLFELFDLQFLLLDQVFLASVLREHTLEGAFQLLNDHVLVAVFGGSSVPASAALLVEGLECLGGAELSGMTRQLAVLCVR